MNPTPHPSAPNPSLSVDAHGIGWLVFNDPHRPVNVLTRDILEEFGQAVHEAEKRARRKEIKVLVIWSGKEDTFLAGADVGDIENIREPSEGEAGARRVQEMFQRLADLPVPTLAAIHGTCLGGGLEMALACDVRYVSDAPETSLGLPEVLLGILPAFGGTTRMVQEVGLRRAAREILSGRRSSATDAVAMGLAHAVLPSQGFRGQVEHQALRLASGHPPPKARRGLVDTFLERFPLGRRLILAETRRKALRFTGGHYPAPLQVLEVMQKSWGLPTRKGLDIEAQAIGRLVASQVSKNLIHLFHLREDARKGRGIPEGTLVLPRVPQVAQRPDGGPALLVFRVIGAFLAEARRMEEDGLERREIDGAARAFGLAKGPFEIETKRNKRRRVEAPGSRRDPLLEERLVLPMINEASRILEEEAPRAGAIDLAVVVGGGFPAFRGGLLHYADALGLDHLLNRFQYLSIHLGPRFEPPPLLAELVRERHTFYSRFP